MTQGQKPRVGPEAPENDMSNRSTTLILPTHNSQTLSVLLAIVTSEGKTDSPDTITDRVDIFRRETVAGFTTRRAAEGWSEVFQTDNLHITVTPDRVRYDASSRRYRVHTIRAQLSAYSCDPYGREAIAAIVDKASTRY